MLLPRAVALGPITMLLQYGTRSPVTLETRGTCNCCTTDMLQCGCTVLQVRQFIGFNLPPDIFHRLKCIRFKMTQIVQKLQFSLSLLKCKHWCQCRLVGSTSYINVITSFAQILSFSLKQACRLWLIALSMILCTMPYRTSNKCCFSTLTC